MKFNFCANMVTEGGSSFEVGYFDFKELNRFQCQDLARHIMKHVMPSFLSTTGTKSVGKHDFLQSSLTRSPAAHRNVTLPTYPFIVLVLFLKVTEVGPEAQTDISSVCCRDNERVRFMLKNYNCVVLGLSNKEKNNGNFEFFNVNGDVGSAGVNWPPILKRYGVSVVVADSYDLTASYFQNINLADFYQSLSTIAQPGALYFVDAKLKLDPVNESYQVHNKK